MKARTLVLVLAALAVMAGVAGCNAETYDNNKVAQENKDLEKMNKESARNNPPGTGEVR